MASDQSFYEAFHQAQMNREIRSAVSATEVNEYLRATYALTLTPLIKAKYHTLTQPFVLKLV